MENETAALASFSTSFISLILFLGTHSAGHHIPQTLCLGVAASSALRRRTGCLAPCRVGPSPRDPFSSYANTRTISDKHVLFCVFFFFIGCLFNFFFHENTMGEEGLFWLRVEFLTRLVGKENGSGTSFNSM